MSIVNILSDTWEATFRSKLVKWFIGSFVAIMSIVTLTFTSLGLTIWESIAYSLCINISLLILFLIFNFIMTCLRASKIERKSIYGEILLVLKDFFSKINFLRKLTDVEAVYLKPALQEVCDNLKKCYDKKTRSKCCVSIKLFEKITGDGNIDTNATVYNLCRDSDSVSLRDSDVYKNINHTVFKNTPFSSIVRELLKSESNIQDCYYINNNIPNTNNYASSSFAAYVDGKLPYKSEIVVPLLPLNNEDGSRPDLIGFICIDSNKKNSFGTKYDLPMLQGVADGIHDVIIKWRF